MVALDASILQAPFYLFDEIDAALDAQYRTAVARQGVDLQPNPVILGSDARDDLQLTLFSIQELENLQNHWVDMDWDVPFSCRYTCITILY